MSDTPAGSWQPDPYGRYAQRYHDGTNWTANVTDATGAQLTDPPGYANAPASAGATSSSSSLPVPGLVIAAIGVVLLLLSLFALNWFDFGAAVKADINASSDEFQSDAGVSAASITDGIKLSDIRDLADANDQSDISTVADQYIKWGYIAAVLAAGFAVVALFAPQLRWPALAVAIGFAVWHAYVVYDLSSDSLDTQIGAWLGALGLALAGVALLLPRQMSVARAT